MGLCALKDFIYGIEMFDRVLLIDTEHFNSIYYKGIIFSVDL